MPRQALNPDERRRTISFTAQIKIVKMLDEYIEDLQKQVPQAYVSRQTILENLLLDFLEECKLLENGDLLGWEQHIMEQKESRQK